MQITDKLKNQCLYVIYDKIFFNSITEYIYKVNRILTADVKNNNTHLV